MNPSSRRASGPRRQKGCKPHPLEYQYGTYPPAPSLFDDTSSAFDPSPYPPNPGSFGPPGWDQHLDFVRPTFPGLSDPMASMAMQYGQSIAGHGKQMVEEKLEKYVSVSKVKYYFAVDTKYVVKKLGLLFFPFTHKEWAVHFNNQNEPVAPKYDINAPDLYIPTMAFVTYILIAGYIMGSQNRFSPEQLGVQASSALGLSFLELGVLFIALFFFNPSSSVTMFDWIAFCSYKYVCMVAALIAGITFQTFGYYVGLGYLSLSLVFFLIRTLRVLVLPKTTSDHYSSNNRSKLVFGISFLQPVLMYFLTKQLVFYQKINELKS